MINKTYITIKNEGKKGLNHVNVCVLKINIIRECTAAISPTTRRELKMEALGSYSLPTATAFAFSKPSVSASKPPFLAFSRRAMPVFGVLSASRTADAAPSVADSPDNHADKEVKLWGGRFEESVTDAVERFTESISYDKQLYKHDIRGSRAHASMLAKQVCFDFSPSSECVRSVHFSLFDCCISFDSTTIWKKNTNAIDFTCFR